MAKKDKTIDPINDTFENVANAMVQVPPSNSNKSKGLAGDVPPQVPAQKQMPLDLGVEIQKDVNGIEMGVLENGIPYLTQAGLSRITGTTPKAIRGITQEWEEHFADEVIGKDRISFLKEYLFRLGYAEPQLYIEIQKDGSTHYAYPDIVCTAILEYYAFEAKNRTAAALQSYRQIAAFGLREFIYEALDYTPVDKWIYHHERVSLLNDSSPPGHFIVFNEITGLIVDLINADLTVNHKTIPDLSVGQHWAKYWNTNNLHNKYGDRIKYDHNYPDRYPQSWSNPQEANAYPDEALPEFRRWFREHYLPTKFPVYILKKAKILSGGKQEAEKIANLYNEKQIEHKP